MKRLLPLLCALLPVLQAAEKPNVIYILADDLGYGDLSCYGQKKFKTPHIDSLAKDGMKFTNHYSGNTVCSPSRAVLMTGEHSGRSYLRGNVPTELSAALPDEMTVLPEVFKQAGYRTGAFGKWGLGITNGERLELPSTHGFDEFTGWKSQAIAHTYYPSSYIHNSKEISLDGETYLSPIVMKAARDFIAESAKNDEPFFCYIPTAIPHAAMHAPKELHEKWRKRFPEFDDVIGKYWVTEFSEEGTPDVVNPIAAFPAMMEHLDDEVGTILKLLDDLEISQNTLIMFASDNGAHKEGGHRPEFWNSTGGLRGFKRDIHEGGIKTPFLARWTGKIPAGSISTHLSGFHDLLPTACELAGEETPEQNTGLSFLPALLGNEKEQQQHDYLIFEFRSEATQEIRAQALRFGDWKVFLEPHQEDSIELFNLKDDPYEQKNLAKEESSKSILAKARSYLAEGSTPLLPSEKE